MSYYNDFSLALEQQSNDLDNMLAELESFDAGSYSGALESVQSTVADIYDADACESLLDNLGGVMEAYNSALEQMRDAAEEYQYTNDADAAREAMYPAQESLKEIYYNITGYAPEGSIDQSMIGEIRNFLTGSREIIEERMSELGGYGYAGESYYDEGYDYELCDAYENMCNACESYNDFIVYEYAEYGYAFESEASGAEKAKKEGLLARMKRTVQEFCRKMADSCQRKRDETQNKALKAIYNTFNKIFNKLAGKIPSANEPEAVQDIKEEADENVEKLNEEVAKQGGNTAATNPKATKNTTTGGTSTRKEQKAKINKIKQDIADAKRAGRWQDVKRLEAELDIASTEGKSIASHEKEAKRKADMNEKWSGEAGKAVRSRYNMRKVSRDDKRNGTSNKVGYTLSPGDKAKVMKAVSDKAIYRHKHTKNGRKDKKYDNDLKAFDRIIQEVADRYGMDVAEVIKYAKEAFVDEYDNMDYAMESFFDLINL